MTIRSIMVIFCDNDHGTGEQTYPDVDRIAASDFVAPRGRKQLREDAKRAGWTFPRGLAFCPLCSQTED